MRRRVASILVVALSSFVPAAVADIEADVPGGKKLLAEGDALADKGETTEAVVRYKQAFEKLLPAMRKLPFKHEVKRDVTAREDMGAMLRKEIEAELSPQDLKADELGMKALGLLPHELDLKETMIKIYSEEIAAFYDPRTKTMHLIREPEEKLKKKPGFLERLLGKKGGFDKDENKTVIAHELTHALADQHYDIDRMQKAVKRDDDRDLALSALIEGEATLTMIGASQQDWTGVTTSEIPSRVLEKLFGFLSASMPMFGGQSLREAPVILSETMIFPYFRGVVFCADLTNHGGWKAINAAYERPPLSTEQVLHPDKYHGAHVDLPTAIDLGALNPGEGWKEAGRNVVGEMQLAVMLRNHGGKRAAAGWDGDRFVVFEGPHDRIGLVWFSTWDNEEEAAQFVDAFAAYQANRIAAAPPRTGSGPSAAYVVERRGADVAVVEGFSADETDPLVQAAFAAKKTEMSYPADPKAK